MKVLVSGILGRIGRYVYRALVDHGHGALGGFGSDAVIRLGAWAHAGQVPDAKTYGDNVTGTFNVF